MRDCARIKSARKLFLIALDYSFMGESIDKSPTCFWKKNIMEEYYFLENNKPKSNNKKLHAYILWILGIILAIAGFAIITIPGTGLRGSGLGTALLLPGFLMLLIGVVRYMYKPK